MKYRLILVLKSCGSIVTETSWLIIFRSKGNQALHQVQFCVQILLINRTLVPCPFTGPKMFWAGPNFSCQTKNSFMYCGSHKYFVPDKKNYLHSVKSFLCQHKSFWRATECSQIFWVGSKHFGTCKRTRHKKKRKIRFSLEPTYWVKKEKRLYTNPFDVKIELNWSMYVKYVRNFDIYSTKEE